MSKAKRTGGRAGTETFSAISALTVNTDSKPAHVAGLQLVRETAENVCARAAIGRLSLPDGRAALWTDLIGARPARRAGKPALLCVLHARLACHMQRLSAGRSDDGKKVGPPRRCYR